MDFIKKITDSLASLMNKKGDDDKKDSPKVSHDAVDGTPKDTTDANGEKEEIRDGILYIDGVKLGPASTGALSSNEDILDMLRIPANYTIPEKILLPGDLAAVKFPREPDGFSRDDVAAFYDNVVSSINYYIDLLNKRNTDVKKLAEHIDDMTNEIHDKDIELQLQKNGLTVITGEDNKNENMNLQLKIQKLRAENKLLKSKVSETEASNQINDLKKNYDEVQDQLAMEQYSNKQLTETNKELNTRLHALQESGADGNDTDFAEEVSSIEMKKSSPSRNGRTPISLPKKAKALHSSTHHNDDHVKETGTQDQEIENKSQRTSLRSSAPKKQLPRQPKNKLNHSRSDNKDSAIDNALSSLDSSSVTGEDEVDIFDDDAPFDEVSNQVMNDEIDFD
jgi:uncharacterized protein YpmB